MGSIASDETSSSSSSSPSSPSSSPAARSGGAECEDARQVSSPSPEVPVDIKQGIYRLTFSVGKSWRYHSKRRQCFDSMEFFRKTISVLSGSGAAFSAFSHFPSWITGVFALIIAIVSAADLVVSFSARSRLHESLCRRYVELLATIHGTVNPSASDLAKFKSERFKIEADSPPALKVLDDWCYNEEACSHGSNARIKLTAWQIRLMDWIDVPPYERKLMTDD